MNKQLGLDAVASHLRDGMTVGIGGWGPRRKPMAVVRELLKSPVKDLTVVAYGGPEVGMLCAAGKVRKLVYGFVTLDAIPLEPYFRKAREAGALEVCELDEGLLHWGLRAAGMRVPFLPTRVGLGSDILTYNPSFKTVQSPYADGEVLLAMPALALDLALLHVDTADRLGNTHIHGPDPFFDDLFARAAKKTIVSCEEIHDRLDIARPEDAKANLFERNLVTHVIHAPFGAHPTSCAPRYGWDMGHLKQYVASASQADGWSAYGEQFLRGDEAAYQSAVGGVQRIGALPMPIF
ncbi:MAG: CoA-transferase [Pseudomonadota bacterium]